MTRSTLRIVLAVLFAAGFGVWSAATGPLAVGATNCHGKPVTILVDSSENGPVQPGGTDGDDVVLLKGSGLHSFDARGGDDTVCVQGFGSMVTAGSGNDWVSAEATDGPVTIMGDDGDDTLIGSDLSDQLYGGWGADRLRGLAGDDSLLPDNTDLDHQQVTADGADTVDGGPGDDLLTVSMLPAAKTVDADRLQGGSGHDVLRMFGSRFALDLQRGVLRTASGGPVDRVAGLEGCRCFVPARIHGAERAESFYLAAAGITLDAAGGNDAIVIAAAESKIKAGAGNDTVTQTADADTRSATIGLGIGDDRLVLAYGRRVEATGGPGDDTFQLQTQRNSEDDPYATGPITGTLRGQSGDDTLTWDCRAAINVPQQRLTCSRRPAALTISGMQSYQAAADWPRVNSFRGGPHRDIYRGGDRADTMNGGAGNDILDGSGGQDTADGGPGRDRCSAEVTKRC